MDKRGTVLQFLRNLNINALGPDSKPICRAIVELPQTITQPRRRDSMLVQATGRGDVKILKNLARKVGWLKNWSRRVGGLVREPGGLKKSSQGITFLKTSRLIE